MRLKKELTQRDLKKVKTHRLIDLLIKIYSLFDREEKAEVEVNKMYVDIKRMKALLGEKKDEPEFYLVCTDFMPGKQVPKGQHVIDLTGENPKEFLNWKKRVQN